MKKRICILFFLSFSLFSALPDGRAGEVEEKLEQVLAELDTPYQNWDPPPFLKEFIRLLGDFFRFLTSAGWVYRFLFYLLVAALLFYMGNRILRIFMPDRALSFSKRGKEKDTKGDPENKRDDYHLRAVESAGKGAFSHGVILLHLGSLQYLLEHHYLNRGRDYTNREILRTLKGNHLAVPFGTIARQAEMIRFKGTGVGEEAFRSLETTYRESFYE